MADSDPVVTNRGDMRRLMNAARRIEKTALLERGRPAKGPIPEGEGGCDTQNAIWDIAIHGNPDGGTFVLEDVEVNEVSEDITFAFDDTAAEVKTKLVTHAEISTDDLIVTGTFPNSTMRVEFTGSLAGQDILPPRGNWDGLSGTGLGIYCGLAQKGHS